MQISVQIGLDWNWPTGTELGKTSFYLTKIDYITTTAVIEVWTLRKSPFTLGTRGMGVKV